jgi:hypothetical protein
MGAWLQMTARPFQPNMLGLTPAASLAGPRKSTADGHFHAQPPQLLRLNIRLWHRNECVITPL